MSLPLNKHGILDPSAYCKELQYYSRITLVLLVRVFRNMKTCSSRVIFSNHRFMSLFWASLKRAQQDGDMDILFLTIAVFIGDNEPQNSHTGDGIQYSFPKHDL